MAPKQIPGGARRVAAEGPLGLRELDRFSETSLERWNAVSQDLDELHDSLYFGLEPERRRYRSDLIAALNSVASVDLSMAGWCRAVTYRYSLAPLSCAGSLQYIGGRFNAGTELDPQTLAAWPALYLAADFETAFREKFQLNGAARGRDQGRRTADGRLFRMRPILRSGSCAEVHRQYRWRIDSGSSPM